MSNSKKGEKKTSKRKFFPGYILVRMELTDETWHLVKRNPKVTGFIGTKDRPSPIPDASVQSRETKIDEGTLKPQPKFKFEVGDHVRIVDGPFTNFDGVVDEVRPEKGKFAGSSYPSSAGRPRGAGFYTGGTELVQSKEHL